MANRKTSLYDANFTAALLVREATGSGRVRGEDLIGNPKTRKAFIAAKKQAQKKKP